MEGLIDPGWFNVLLMSPVTDDTSAIVTLVHGNEKWYHLPDGLFIRSLRHVTSSRPIKCLSLKHHCLSSLPTDLVALSTCLITLDLSFNGFVTVPRVTCQLIKLKELFINNNVIETLPGEIEGLIDLQVLHLEHNKLTNLPPTIGKLTSLVVLNLEHNLLTSLPNEIKELKKLTKLLLANNKLSELPATIIYLDNLEELHIANNKLQRLPDEDFSCLKSLKQLNIANNNIKMLPFSLARIDLQGLSVGGNPLAFPPIRVCRQGIARIQQYIKEMALQRDLQLVGVDHVQGDKSVCVYSSTPYDSDNDSDNSNTHYEQVNDNY